MLVSYEKNLPVAEPENDVFEITEPVNYEPKKPMFVFEDDREEIPVSAPETTEDNTKDDEKLKLNSMYGACNIPSEKIFVSTPSEDKMTIDKAYSKFAELFGNYIYNTLIGSTIVKRALTRKDGKRKWSIDNACRITMFNVLTSVMNVDYDFNTKTATLPKVIEPEIQKYYDFFNSLIEEDLIDHEALVPMMEAYFETVIFEGSYPLPDQFFYEYEKRMKADLIGLSEIEYDAIMHKLSAIFTYRDNDVGEDSRGEENESDDEFPDDLDGAEIFIRGRNDTNEDPDDAQVGPVESIEYEDTVTEEDKDSEDDSDPVTTSIIDIEEMTQDSLTVYHSGRRSSYNLVMSPETEDYLNFVSDNPDKNKYQWLSLYQPYYFIEGEDLERLIHECGDQMVSKTLIFLHIDTNLYAIYWITEQMLQMIETFAHTGVFCALFDSLRDNPIVSDFDMVSNGIGTEFISFEAAKMLVDCFSKGGAVQVPLSDTLIFDELAFILQDDDPVYEEEEEYPTVRGTDASEDDTEEDDDSTDVGWMRPMTRDMFQN